MLIFSCLLLAHLLYDFHLQGEFIGTMKAKYDFILFIHSLTWAMLLCAVLLYFGVFHALCFPWLLWTHFVIDRWKSRSPNDESKMTWRLWVDQGLHVVTMIIVVWAVL